MLVKYGGDQIPKPGKGGSEDDPNDTDHEQKGVLLLFYFKKIFYSSIFRLGFQVNRTKKLTEAQ